MVYKVLFSEAKIALNREVRNHPKLIELLQLYGRDDWPGILGEIAAYCGFVMDGNYSDTDLERLYPLLIQKLKDKGSIIILPPPGVVH